jgi:hypothetical protein
MSLECGAASRTSSRALRLAGALLLGALASGCGSPLPLVLTGTGPQRAVAVPYPPPAALPEIVPSPPSERAAWLDGHWTWRGDTWVWQRGGYVEQRPGVVRVPWRLEYTENGTLLFYSENWVRTDGRTVIPPRIVKPPGYPPTPRVAEDARVP